MAFEIRKVPGSPEQTYAPYIDKNNNFCGEIIKTLELVSHDRLCPIWSNFDTNCTKAKSLIVFDDAIFKFTINPT